MKNLIFFISALFFIGWVLDPVQNNVTKSVIGSDIIVSYEYGSLPLETGPRALQDVKNTIIEDRILSVVNKYPTRISKNDAKTLAENLIEYGNKLNVDPFLLLALIRIESAFDKNAISKVNALGMMQVLPKTGRSVANQIGLNWYGDHYLHNPEFNVRIGSEYLKQLLLLYENDLHLALTAYNRGPHNVDAILLRDGYLKPEFLGYATKVVDIYERYITTQF